jgi:hypothetical protein
MCAAARAGRSPRPSARGHGGAGRNHSSRRGRRSGRGADGPIPSRDAGTPRSRPGYAGEPVRARTRGPIAGSVRSTVIADQMLHRRYGSLDPGASRSLGLHQFQILVWQLRQHVLELTGGYGLDAGSWEATSWASPAVSRSAKVSSVARMRTRARSRGRPARRETSFSNSSSFMKGPFCRGHGHAVDRVHSQRPSVRPVAGPVHHQTV